MKDTGNQSQVFHVWCLRGVLASMALKICSDSNVIIFSMAFIIDQILNSLALNSVNNQWASMNITPERPTR